MASSSSSSPEISAAPTTITADNSSNYSSLDDVLEDLSSRFILNLPESELASVERICFQVEQAHWFYEDFVREGNPQFPSLPLKKFSQIFFHACPVLHEWSSDFEIAFNNFMQYKTRVPVCGAIMLNDTWEKCILVKGWKSSAGWGFPKGKINQDEERHKCAIREVYEETGYDLTGQIDTENVIELSIKQQKISLYIVPGVPEDYPFKTRTRKEISKIDWFKLSDLPTWKKSGVPSGKFYLISPFIAPLKNFIQDRKPSSLKRKPRRTRNAIPFTNGISHPDESADSSLESPPHAHSIPDSTTQESSSQSSYAENGGLQTPSPEYSHPRLNEPHIANANNGVDSRPEIIYGKLADSEAVVPHPDDHLARLMQSLSMSAGHNDGNNNKPVLSQLSTKPPLTPAASTTPVPTTASSGDSHPLMEPTDVSDWSSHAPRRVSERQVPISNPSLPSVAVPLSKPAYNPVHIDTSFSHGVVRTSVASYSQVPTLPSASPMANSSPRHQRSMSALSFSNPRSSEMTPAVKRMKQLALLESVADESTRMTPTLEQQATMLHRQPVLNGMSRSPSMPRPSASVPPHQGVHPGFSPSVLYSSAYGSAFAPARVPSVPTLLPPLSSVIGDDPFTIRPRNGDAAAYMQSPHHIHGRVRQSMNETQLAPMLQRQPPGPYPQVQAFPPPPPYMQPAPLSHHPQYFPARMPPSHVMSHTHLPVSQPFIHTPVSAPATSPHFEIPPIPQHFSHPPRNAQLLSILNANGSTRSPIGHQPSMITPMGVVNGIEHR